VHWCRPRVKFNEVPEKVPKVPEKVPKVPEKVWEVLVQSQVTFNRVPEKVPEKGLWCRARSSSTGARFGKRFQEGLVPEKVPEKVGEAWVQSHVPRLVQSQARFNRVLDKVPDEVWEALVQSQVRFNRVPKKVPEVPGGFGAEPRQAQRFRRRFPTRPGRLWREPGQT